MAAVTVRYARPGDAPGIRRVARATWHAAYDDIVGEGTVEETVDAWYDLEDLRSAMRRQGVTHHVATDGETIVGFTGLRPTDRDDTAELFRLYVHPDRWGNGIGGELLEATIRSAEGAVERVTVTVLAENEVDRSFYESSGFDRLGVGYDDHIRRAHVRARIGSVTAASLLGCSPACAGTIAMFPAESHDVNPFHV